MPQYKKDCLFCKFAKHEVDVAVAYEDDKVIAFLDINPAGILSGHTVIIPKKHFEMIDEVDDDYLEALSLAIKKLVPAIRKVSCAQGINIVQNNGKVAGQLIPHVHFHIIPRKQRDGIHFDENRRAAKPM